MMRLIVMVFCMIVGLAGSAAAQTEKMNFRDRQAVVINDNQSFIQLSQFSFENVYRQSRTRLVTNLSWKNISKKPITAFEVVILRYDPFNRPIGGGGRWMVTGKNSGDWTPLAPGESSSDGLIGHDDEPVLTSIAYIHAIRFADGDVWTADTKAVASTIRKKLPVLKELGDLAPIKKKEQ